MKSVYTLVCALGLVALLVGWDSKSRVTIPMTTTVASTDHGRWLIQYYVSSNILSYAVMIGPLAKDRQGRVDFGKGNVHAGASTPDGKVRVNFTRPDGSEIPILDSGRIFQVSGTNVIECPQHISGKTFQAFLESRPSEYSISTLLTFAKAHK